ncbi:MAG: hypothetical protein ABI835_04835, partial [Chloroflexota bacterium]
MKNLFSAVDNWRRKPLWLLAIAVSLIPLVLVVVMIAADGRNVPFYDQWDTSDIIATKTLDGSLLLTDLLDRHGEHRIFFTNLITMVSARFFHWNLYLELFVTVGLAFALLIIIVLLIRHDFPKILVAVLFPVSVLIFSLRGRQTWMTSFQSCFLLVTLFFLLAVLTLQRGRVGWRSLLLAAFFALCATFALTNGLITWGVLFIGLLLLGYRKPAYLLFWIAASGLTIWVYHKLPATIQLPPPHLADFPTLVQYVLRYLGNIFILHYDSRISLDIPALATIISTGLLLANGIYLWRLRRSWKPLVPWLLIVAYVAGTAFSTAFGRAAAFADSPEQPLSERYIINAVFWWISLIVLGAAVLHAVRKRGMRRRVERLIYTVNLLCLVAAVPLIMYATIDLVRRPNIINPDSETCYAGYALSRDRNLQCLA